MNEPEYILVDEMEVVVADVKAALDLSVLNYQYGYVQELSETLAQFSKSRDHASKKYPLVWLSEPITITRGEHGWYGITDGLQIFIIAESEKTLKAKQRMTQVFKPVIFPIYRELLNQFRISKVFDVIGEDGPDHKITNRYYWGEEQQKIIADVFDCSHISQLKLKINNNPNYTFIKSF